MPISPMELTWVLALLWFLVFWVGGGMVFAAVALTRFLRIKKLHFSCLFTLASAAAAYGAAMTGLMLVEGRAVRCVSRAPEIWEVAKSIVTCGAREIFFAAGAWFALLLLLNILVMLLLQRDHTTSR